MLWYWNAKKAGSHVGSVLIFGGEGDTTDDDGNLMLHAWICAYTHGYAGCFMKCTITVADDAGQQLVTINDPIEHMSSPDLFRRYHATCVGGETVDVLLGYCPLTPLEGSSTGALMDSNTCVDLVAMSALNAPAVSGVNPPRRKRAVADKPPIEDDATALDADIALEDDPASDPDCDPAIKAAVAAAEVTDFASSAAIASDPAFITKAEAVFKHLYPDAVSTSDPSASSTEADSHVVHSVSIADSLATAATAAGVDTGDISAIPDANHPGGAAGSDSSIPIPAAEATSHPDSSSVHRMRLCICVQYTTTLLSCQTTHHASLVIWQAVQCSRIAQTRTAVSLVTHLQVPRLASLV